MNVIGHAVPLIAVAIIVVLIAANAARRRLPRFALPKPRPRPKRSHLRMVKTSTMDRELAELLKNKR